MMSMETSKAIDEVESNFLYDVTKATVALFYLLQGIEIANAFFAQSPRDEGSMPPSLAGPILGHLRAFPAVSTTGPDMLGPNGEAVQLAFKGWVAEIYEKWEKSRTKTRELLDDEGIRVEVDCMGDFRHIRNDLIHSGFATEEESGKCKVLKWFKPGERITLTTDHVFDLLNQMNLIRLPIQLNGPSGPQIASWMLVPDSVKPTSLDEDHIHLVSARMDVDADGGQGSTRYMLGCVFSDGIFGQGPVEVPVEPEQYLQGYVDKNGNITFPSGQVLDAKKLYDDCYGYLIGDRRNGPGILGPDAKYKKNPAS